MSISYKLEKGKSLHLGGKLNDAKKIYQDILLTDPDNFLANHLLGALEIQLQNYNNAEGFIRKAIKLDPKSHSTFNNLGVVLRELNKHKESLDAYDKAVELKHDYAEGYNNLGVAYRNLKDYEKSIENYCKALELKSNYAEAYNNRSIVYRLRKEFKRAYDDACDAIKLKLDYAEAYYNRGLVSFETNQFEFALKDFNLSINYKKNFADAYSARGDCFFKLKNYYEAVSSYKIAMKTAQKFKFKFLIGNIYFSLSQVCDWDNLKKINNLFEKTIEENITIEPLWLMYWNDNLELQQKNLNNYIKTNNFDISTKLKLKKNDNKKIHIGYYTADIRLHVMYFLISEILKFHDKNNFIITVFSFKSSKDLNYRNNIKENCNDFIDAEQLSDEQIVLLSRERKIDIAIDLNGFTEFNRSNCFSKRLAPIQISYLGYPGSSGIKNLDYIIADEYLITDEFNKFYSEKILNLPGCYRTHYVSKHSENKNKMTKEIFLLNENKLIFGCFNHPSKINENIFNVWTKILKKIPNSVLWLIEHNLEFKNNLLASACKENIDPSRLVFRKKLPIEEHLKTYKLMDIFLDTFPYNGHTTLCESLYEGTPVITLTGKSFASRVGGSILYNLNMKEMITHNLLEYEEKILEVASSPDILKNIKINLKNNIDKSHVFNPKIYVKNLEKIYYKLMQRENFLNT
ncbi:tetratricopeptide repeat protein [Candidatus Fonsibacter ubiquis]|uniref:tetratricopeptide repeat protein n=1 Tax=Candidatus Fonsibacter ubiquis TaxID=1925548 RepID=UPI000C0836FC|nr:tetratricopeptide repeat protein [Candidatus Fonsibacter ubiquis]